MTKHTSGQKAIEKLKFILFYGVQGENTIARRQKAKIILIDLEIFNSSPKLSVYISVSYVLKNKNHELFAHGFYFVTTQKGKKKIIKIEKKI